MVLTGSSNVTYETTRIPNLWLDVVLLYEIRVGSQSFTRTKFSATGMNLFPYGPRHAVSVN
jgi:hypothetical protein